MVFVLVLLGGLVGNKGLYCLYKDLKSPESVGFVPGSVYPSTGPK